MQQFKRKTKYINLLCSLNPETHIELEKCLNFYGYINTQQISTHELRAYCELIGII